MIYKFHEEHCNSICDVREVGRCATYEIVGGFNCPYVECFESNGTNLDPTPPTPPPGTWSPNRPWENLTFPTPSTATTTTTTTTTSTMSTTTTPTTTTTFGSPSETRERGIFCRNYGWCEFRTKNMVCLQFFGVGFFRPQWSKNGKKLNFFPVLSHYPLFFRTHAR